MNLYIGAGFYSSSDPFRCLLFLGHVPPENVAVFTWKSGPPGKAVTEGTQADEFGMNCKLLFGPLPENIGAIYGPGRWSKF